MKASELRLGNIVQTEHGFPMRVTGIFSDVVYLDFTGNEGDVWEEKEQDIEPYPITEGLLLKLGFKKRPVDFPSYNHSGTHVNFIKGKWIDYVYRRELTGLHSLQNLYLSVRGLELHIPDLSH